MPFSKCDDPSIGLFRPSRQWVGWQLLLILLLFGAACNRQPTTWDRVREIGVLRVGLDPTYPPFAVLDDAGLRGIDVDLAHAVAAELGLTVEFTYFGYDGLYDALGTSQVDVLVSALVIQPERTATFAYGEPYFNAGQVLVVHEDEDDISALADMEGREMAVELGAEGHVIASQWTRRLSEFDVLAEATADEALARVAAGDASAALVDAVSARQFVSRQPGLEIRGAPVTVDPYAFVVREEDETLLKQLNEALAALADRGELDLILARWLGG